MDLLSAKIISEKTCVSVEIARRWMNEFRADTGLGMWAMTTPKSTSKRPALKRVEAGPFWEWLKTNRMEAL